MKYLAFIFMLLFYIRSHSQNLVPNWNFNDSTCSIPCEMPTEYCLANWFSPTMGSPDYYLFCHQNTLNGSCGYESTSMNVLPNSGIIAYYDTFSVREYISVRLIESLKPNTKYNVEFSVKFCKFSQKAIDVISLYIGDSIYQNSADEIPVSPQINSPSNIFLSDTLNWVKISGIYTANGTENFIIIGNFKNNVLTNSTNVPWGVDLRSYYLIDNVSIVEMDTTITEFSFYPNPNNGNFTLNYNLGESENGKFKIYNDIGQLVYEEKLMQNNGSLNGMVELSSGVYVWYVEGDGVFIKNDKFIVVK